VLRTSQNLWFCIEFEGVGFSKNLECGVQLSSMNKSNSYSLFTWAKESAETADISAAGMIPEQFVHHIQKFFHFE